MRNNFNKILITGASGMLGLAFQKKLDDQYAGIDIKALSKKNLDVSNYEAVMSYKHFNADVIIHCAAIVNADYCEINYDEAYKTIVEGTKNIVKLANETNAKILYPQSFLIFDGETKPVNEETKPNPLSAYGRLKLMAEEIILENTKNSLIIRMGGFFGGYKKDKNFVGKIVPEIVNKIENNINEIEIGDRIWQPTYTEDLALNCLKLIEKNKKGVYTMASLNEASFYDLTVKIVEYLNLYSTIKIKKISSLRFDTIEDAKRPKEVYLSNAKLEDEGLNMQRNWEESLREYIHSDYFNKILNKG